MSTSEQPVGALAKAMTVVETLALHGEMSPADIATASGIPRSTVYRLLGGLQEAGRATFRDEAAASLTLKLTDLADGAREAMTEWAPITAILPNITRTFGMTSFLSVRRGDETVCIRWVQGTGIDALVLRPGRTLPLHAGAAGRAALAALDDGEREEYLSRAPFRPFNHNSLVSRQELAADISWVRDHGYAFSQEDVTLGVGAVGITVEDPAHPGGIGCVSVGGLIGEITANHERLAAVIREEVAGV
ncbi:MAG: helix-turn-helix domain-containing protein [Acidipropionibacterium jensenii]|nr:helix-turn-helix domain-containing protein [Acidipropionibacterium jensenii]